MRSEQLSVKVRIPKSGYEQFKDRIIPLAGKQHVKDGDHVNLTYTLQIDYIGNAGRNLQTICDLKRSGCPTTISVEELRHGRCLVLELLQNIDQLIG